MHRHHLYPLGAVRMLLEMSKITKSYGNLQILHGVDLTLKAGEVHALIGHNGAGKSTLIKVLAGNFADYGGNILIEGRTCNLHSPKHAIDAGIAIIYQDFSLAPNLSVAANIALGREPEGRVCGLMPHRKVLERSQAEADALKISLPMTALVGTLGVATQQMTEIVRACSQEVKILVMDEPTARLAPLERARLFAVMRQMCKERGVGIIYISHFLEEVREIADRITVLKDGRAVETGKSSNYTVDDLARLLVGHSDPLLKPKSDKRPEKQSETPSRAITITDVNAVGRPGWDITLHEGEILGIAGLVGSGRTTLMRAIVGEIGSSGHVQIGDKVLKKRTPKSMAQAGLVMVPEDRKISGLALQASIVANMEVTALAKRLSKFGIVRRAKTRAMVDDKIRSLRIMPPDLHKPVGLLSGGNAQKVLLGRALAAEPKVLILDQPTAGVDIGAKAEIHKVIISAAEASAAVILVSDDLDELLGLSDRIVVISEGRPQPALRADEFDRAELLAATSS